MNPVWVKTWVSRKNAGLTGLLTRIAFLRSCRREKRDWPVFQRFSRLLGRFHSDESVRALSRSPDAVEG